MGDWGTTPTKFCDADLDADEEDDDEEEEEGNDSDSPLAAEDGGVLAYY